MNRRRLIHPLRHTAAPLLLLATALAPLAPADAQSRIEQHRRVLDQSPPGETVIDLGDRGLEPGDRIDPYFEQYLDDNVQLRIPEGTYRWDASFRRFRFANTSIVGQGEVVLHANPGYNADPTFTAIDGGDLEVRNITIRGQGGTEGKIRVVTEGQDSRVIFRNFNQPDGSVPGDGSSRSGVFVNRAHEGTFYAVNCHIEGFADNGIYASAPGQETAGHGEVHVIGGLYRNNNIANVRVGSTNSSIIGVVSVQDRHSPPAASGGRNQRGLRVREHGENILIRDCDVIQVVSGNGAIVREGSTGGSGRIENCRIRNDISAPAIGIREQADWTVRGVHLTGTNNEIQGVNAVENVCRGDQCQPPRSTFRHITSDDL